MKFSSELTFLLTFPHFFNIIFLKESLKQKTNLIKK